MKKIAVCIVLAAAGLLRPAVAVPSYLACQTHTNFEKRAPHDTVWLHSENDHFKIFKIDDQAKTIAVYNRRSKIFVPICAAANTACVAEWQGDKISVSAMGGPDDPQRHLDFRRSIELAGNHVHFVLADYGDSSDGRPNMSWIDDGNCTGSTTMPEFPKRAPRVNARYQDVGPAHAVDAAEAAQALAPYNNNTMTGYSGGNDWFHGWFFTNGDVFLGDDEDMSANPSVARMYVGKDRLGYRLCRAPIPAAGESKCFPLLAVTLGQSWVEHDMDGDADFTLLKGRQ